MINFIQDELGDWVNTEARLSRLDTIFAIDIQTATSRFNPNLPTRYNVVLDYGNRVGNRTDVLLKSFDSLTDARKFAAKQAAILNGDD